MLGDGLRRMQEDMRRKSQNFKSHLNVICENATVAAVNKAASMTPPNNAELSGTNTRSGDLAQHWATDSRTKPINGQTVLANNMQYASYVNDGHRVDQHFVPGLHVVGGMLNYDADYDGGLVVGTKTKYVQGLYMKEAGIAEYKRVVEFELQKAIREDFQ